MRSGLAPLEPQHLLGSEFRHGTVKRFLTLEPRRLRALGSKALVGAAAMSAVIALAGVVGWTGARLVGSMHDVVVPWDGRTLLATGVTAILAASVAFSLSAITRSDSFARVGTLALVLIVEPLARLIPKVGNYTIGTGLDALEAWVSGSPSEIAAVSTSTAMITLGLWLAAFIGIGASLFVRRDV